MGLAAMALREYGDATPGGYALVGPIGSGKTAALDAMRGRCSGRVVLAEYGAWSPGDRTNLDSIILERMISAWGIDDFDVAWKGLQFQAGSRVSLAPDERFRLIASFAQVRRPALVALDEVHVLEQLEQPEIAGVADGLARLSEAVRGGGGALFLSMTPAVWDKLGPRARDRFLLLEAEPSLDETVIHAVAHEGLSHAPEGPRTCERELITMLAGECESMRVLHERLHAAWACAQRESAGTLRKEHAA